MEQSYKKTNCLYKSIFNNKDPPPQHLASTFLCSGLNNNITQIIKLVFLLRLFCLLLHLFLNPPTCPLPGRQRRELHRGALRSFLHASPR